MTLPLAHAGHWIAGLLYIMPLVVVVGGLAIQAKRDRRREELEGRDAPDGAVPDGALPEHEPTAT